jgi:transaldolase
MKTFFNCQSFSDILEAATNNNIDGFMIDSSAKFAPFDTHYYDLLPDIVDHLRINKPNSSISVEIFENDLSSMGKQIIKMHELSKTANYNIYSNIPLLMQDGTSTIPLYKDMSDEGISCNIVGVVDRYKADVVIDNLNHFVDSIITVRTNSVESFKNIKSSFDSLKNNNTKIKFMWYNDNLLEAKESDCDINLIGK